MKTQASFVLVGLLLLTSFSTGSPVQERKPDRGVAPPYGQASYIERFEGQKKAGAIVIGDGATYMGLYVFDRFGNCVAHDDFSAVSAARDDLAVEWYPAETGPYTVQVCNFGRASNEFTMVMR